ncbi:DLA class II histocompatibility antigen, partial [Nibea albiflora]
DALFAHGLLRCLFSTLEDLVYLEQVYMNKELLIQFNSTLGKYTGYTEQTKQIAEDINKNSSYLRQAKKNEEACIAHIKWLFEVSSGTVEPYVRLRSVKAVGSTHPKMLACSAYSFYPKRIRMTWLRNGQEATSDVTSTVELPDGNWLYQMHSYLEFTPRSGEKISCMVEHATLKQPNIYDWEEVTDESERNKYAVGAAGLLLGLVFFITGLIYFKKNAAGK